MSPSGEWFRRVRVTQSPILSFENVTQRFETARTDTVACRDISLDIDEGEFVAIVGPSGCGKSTLLNLAAGLLAPSSGQVRYRGKPIAGPNTDLGYLTQKDTLLPWRTVEQNVAVALEIAGVDRKQRAERVRRYVELVGLGGFEKHYPSQLSGGMRRRAMLARTLIYQPRILAMDEPFGALDSQLRLVMQSELLRIWTETRCTTLFVTHDVGEAIALADRVVVFNGRPGRIAVVERVELPRPRDVFRIRFDRRFNEMHDRVWGYLEDSVRLAAAAG